MEKQILRNLNSDEEILSFEVPEENIRMEQNGVTEWDIPAEVLEFFGINKQGITVRVFTIPGTNVKQVSVRDLK